MADEFDPTKPFSTSPDGPVFDPSKPFTTAPPKPSRTWSETAVGLAKQVPGGLAEGALEASIPFGPKLGEIGGAQLGMESLTGPAPRWGVFGTGEPMPGLAVPKFSEQEELAKKGLPEATTPAERIARSTFKTLPEAFSLPIPFAPSPVTTGLAMASGAASQGLREVAPKGMEDAFGIIGGLLPLGLYAAGKGVMSLAGAAPTAWRILNRAFARDGDTVESVMARFAQIQKDRPDAIFADALGPNARVDLERIGQTPSAGLKVVQPVLEARQRAQLDRISGDLSLITGDKRS